MKTSTWKGERFAKELVIMSLSGGLAPNCYTKPHADIVRPSSLGNVLKQFVMRDKEYEGKRHYLFSGSTSGNLRWIAYKG